MRVLVALALVFVLIVPKHKTQDTGNSKPGRLFPDNCPWNTPIPDDAEIDPNSAAILSTTSAHTLKDSQDVFTDGEFPVNRTGALPLRWKLVQEPGYVCGGYPDSVPFTQDMVFQNGPFGMLDTLAGKTFDHHLLLHDTVSNLLYEFYQPRPKTKDTWTCEGGVVWDLTKVPDRPKGATSSDAAGMPILPLLFTADDLARGEINHALRMTVERTLRAFVPPATHWACFEDPKGFYLPMGARVRLRKDFNVTGFSREARIIIRCLQTYGAYIVDNGNNFSISYAQDSRMATMFGERVGPNGDGSISRSIHMLESYKDPKGNYKERHITAADLQVLKLGPLDRTTQSCK